MRSRAKAFSAAFARAAGLALCLLAAAASRPAGAWAPPPCPPASASQPASDASNASDATDTGRTACTRPQVANKRAPTTLPVLFGANYRRDGGPFGANVRKAHAGVFNSVRDWRWVAKDDGKPKPLDEPPGWLAAIGNFFALMASYWLWIVVAVLVLVLLYHHRTWMSWLGELQVPEAGSPIETQAVEAPEPLPDDIPGAVRALWQRGEQRAALALLYQAAVQRLAERLGTPLPPGATEGECLSKNRQINDRRFAGLFVRIVNCWQAAAYARRMPESSLLEGMLADWVQPRPLPQVSA
jgi:hypothetical protein